MISLSLDIKIMISGHIIFGKYIFFENMISRANIKSMPEYGYERDLGLGCMLLGGSKQNCGC
jgi:hypothetical protein